MLRRSRPFWARATSAARRVAWASSQDRKATWPIRWRTSSYAPALFAAAKACQPPPSIAHDEKPRMAYRILPTKISGSGFE